MTLQALFAREGSWTQRTDARSKTGREVSVKSRRAVAFCLLRGIERCYPTSEGYNSAYSKLFERLRMLSTRWNDADDRTIEDVRALVAALDL